MSKNENLNYERRQFKSDGSGVKAEQKSAAAKILNASETAHFKVCGKKI